MASLLRFAAAAALIPALVLAGEIGLGPGPDIVISWTPPDASGNISFKTTCYPHAGEGDIAWCSWGIAPTPGMAPANVRPSRAHTHTHTLARARTRTRAHARVAPAHPIPRLAFCSARRSSGSR